MIILKGILEFFILLVNAWKTFSPLILLVLSKIAAILKFSNTTVPLPIWAILIIGVLALYPIARLLEYGLKRRSTSSVKLYGLLWKEPLLPWQYPVPLCPHNDCGREVVCREIPPPPIQLITNFSDLSNGSRFEYQYAYECPVHGKIDGVPNEDVRLLQHKVMLAIRRR
jgi:hypothetical protein